MPALLFDVYGTLVDPVAAMERAFSPSFAANASQAARDWRAKQVEYAFRRGLMRSDATFEDCARQALQWVAATYAVPLAPADLDALLAAYRRLPAFPEVPAALAALRGVARPLLAFSNGSPDAVDETLRNAGLRDLLDGVVSVREVRSFKPDPAVYRHAAARAGAPAAETWLVSANAWDALGAKGAGLRAAWIRRSAASAPDPWEIAADAVVAGLDGVAGALH